MHIILGGTGHVGSAAARALLDRDEPVTVVGHDPAKAEEWTKRGAGFACVDVHDVGALRAVFRTGRRAFLLNPPAPLSTDTDAEERRTIAAILAALDGSGLEKVVAESTYGAQPGERLGDLSTLYTLEEGLAAQPIPATVQRAAYYYSNWDMAIETARERGVIESFFPEDFALPMVAPEDLGRTAARFLTDPAKQTGLHYVEGPRHYTPANVAAALAEALDRPVRVAVVPREKWIETYRAAGFSEAAASSYARMTGITLDRAYRATDPIRGTIGLRDYLAARVPAGA
ncbi:NAD(P)H-binding protein [Sphingosinicella sp. LHD-64]|uniref:NmrA family NAD(P)-binding protein n=1 Tax=Sphingosinicella sp. LHD-64 TaxID=3072139 RepID=UPI00280ECA76|nr:NmrA family NAD(P)-binding protein [Sphingosinicella sp. LHD-64]MDQ8756626.1 NAD(P)H-binding protein [Sphingosinicella sp. LHD-64]